MSLIISANVADVKERRQDKMTGQKPVGIATREQRERERLSEIINGVPQAWYDKITDIIGRYVKWKEMIKMSVEVLRDFILLALMGWGGLFILIVLLYLGCGIVHKHWWVEDETEDDDDE